MYCQEPRRALTNRNCLRNLYGVIKNSDEHVHFCFLTGMSKFSKVNLFSGLNKLEDTTLNSRCSSICGHTERELETVFADCLEGLDCKQIREWHNGYSWGGPERVYNPFDILLLLKGRTCKNWWFETGLAKFLVDLLLERGAPWDRLGGGMASETLLSKFDVEAIAPEALLFQTGYLTVLGVLEADSPARYRLGYPNREVRESLNAELLDSVQGPGWQRERQTDRLRAVLAAGDPAALRSGQGRCWREFRTSGTDKAPWAPTRAGMPAHCTRTLPRWEQAYKRRKVEVGDTPIWS